ncbi:MAG: ATP-binding protein, partial [Candidatus Methanoperedens sp.]
MSQQKFVDRKEELGFLEERYKTNLAEFVVLYGRRRVGKTELLLKFLENKKGVYLLASTEGDRQNIKDFSKAVGRFIGDENLGAIEFDGWQSFFEALFKHKAFDAMLKKEKIAIIIDEFPFLIQSNKDTPSIFHKIWELIMKKENIMLVLSGSSVAVMESEVLDKKSPLYGRRTGQWQLQPLHFSYLKEFLPYSFEELAMVWFVTGGIPAYLQKFNPK